MTEQETSAEMEARMVHGRPTRRQLLAIVPARGGSRGVPHKNVRNLAGRPMIAFTLDAISEAGVATRIVVSSDDRDILRWAEIHGYESHLRPEWLASDEATVSDVAAVVAKDLSWEQAVGIFQPTSPLRTAQSIVQAVEAFWQSGADSLSTCTREPHLYWFDRDGTLESAEPLFEERRNRQYATHPVVRETGSIQLVRGSALREQGSVVTKKHHLFELDSEESLDVDTNRDLVEARLRVQRGAVVFRLRANTIVGSGHLFHCMQLADELADQHLAFLLKDCEDFVVETLDSHGYAYRIEGDLESDLRALSEPSRNVIVNDVLDTSEEDILVEKARGYVVVNIEDLGPGARFADWVVNALYPIQGNPPSNVAHGAKYATLRSEFHDLPPKHLQPTPDRLLITFGGTDPGGLASRAATALCRQIDGQVRAVVGAGAGPHQYPPEVEVLRNVNSMAAEMMEADLVITSAGRTVYEAAATGTPVVVLAQNAREATHAHLGFDTGVVFLGIGPLVDDAHLVAVVQRLLSDFELRKELSERLRASIDTLGAARIAHQIRALMWGY
jgi:CMP-N-acetylneuraminic acid synthetase/spore coat polysaccharide biosynthesis predicted glycosyltransferase SpsG